MKCKTCGRSLGYDKGACRTYSISWRLVGGTCTKISLCVNCDKSYKDCSPTNSEMRKFFNRRKK